MPEPVSIAASIFSGFNSVLKAVTLAAHYKDVPNEVKQLHTNIDRAENAINIAKRLTREKWHYLNPKLIKDTDDSIDATKKVARLLQDSIEGCRKDLELSTTVSPKNRVVWLLWKNQEFLNQLQTLSNCLTALDREIIRLEMAHPPIIFFNGSPAALIDHDQEHDLKGDDLIASRDGDSDKKPLFPRSPTKRLRSRSKNASQTTLNNQTSPRIENGDEGYQSDEAQSRPRRRGRSPTDQTIQDSEEYPALFANATIGIDTAGLGLTISQGQLNVPQVRFLQEHTASLLSSPPADAIELPSADEIDELGELSTPISRPLSSRNPWHRFVPQRSTPALNSQADGRQQRIPGAWADPVDIRHDELRRAPITAQDEEIMNRNLLGLVASAPATPSWAGSTETLVDPDAERQRLRRRRRSDFI